MSFLKWFLKNMIASDVCYTYIRRYDASELDIEFVSSFMLGNVERNVVWQGKFILDRLGADIFSYHISYQRKNHC